MDALKFYMSTHMLGIKNAFLKKGESKQSSGVRCFGVVLYCVA